MKNVTQTRKQRLPIVNLREFTSYDKLLMLWALCMIDHHKHERNKLSPAKMEEAWGLQVERQFGYCIEWLEAYGLIEQGRLIPTPRGQYAIDNWQAIRDKVFPPFNL